MKDDLLMSLININNSELEEVNSWLDEAVVDLDDFTEFVHDQIKTLNTNIWNLNTGSLALEYICKEADVSELVHYLKGTEFTMNENEANKIMGQVINEDRNPAWWFLYDYVGIDLSTSSKKTTSFRAWMNLTLF